jgi:hypothetical protein
MDFQERRAVAPALRYPLTSSYPLALGVPDKGEIDDPQDVAFSFLWRAPHMHFCVQVIQECFSTD